MIESIVKVLLNYSSDVIAKVLPDDPDEKQLDYIKNSAIVTYHACRTFGLQIVESTENDIDDKILSELLESCKEAGLKYGFSLNDEKL